MIRLAQIVLVLGRLINDVFFANSVTETKSLLSYLRTVLNSSLAMQVTAVDFVASAFLLM